MPYLLETAQNMYPTVGEAYPRLGDVLNGKLGAPVFACYPADCAREVVAL